MNGMESAEQPSEVHGADRAAQTSLLSQARVSADGRHCCIDHIVLRAEGVPATTEDP